MTHTFSNLLFHLVWSTKDRRPLIKREYKPRFYSYIRTVIASEGGNLLYINGVEDHVHLLVALPLTILIPTMVEKVKPVSSKWFNREFPGIGEFGFQWQKGYGAFTVGKSNLQAVIKYIENQEEHHKTLTFEDEMRQLLKSQGIAYDEKYFLK